jgi:hypothetical protein
VHLSAWKGGTTSQVEVGGIEEEDLHFEEGAALEGWFPVLIFNSLCCYRTASERLTSTIRSDAHNLDSSRAFPRPRPFPSHLSLRPVFSPLSKQDQHNEELESEQLFPFPLLNKLISLPFLSPTTAILKQLALLRRDMLSGVYRVLEKLHEKERQDLEEALAGNVQQEKREGAFFLSFSHSALVRLSEHAHGSHLPTETTKSTLSTFLDHFTSAFSALFGRSAAPVDEGTTLDTPSPPRPVLLIDPRSTSEDFDADGARERLRNVQGKEKDRVEGAFRPSRLPADSR